MVPTKSIDKETVAIKSIQVSIKVRENSCNIHSCGRKYKNKVNELSRMPSKGSKVLTLIPYSHLLT